MGATMFPTLLSDALLELLAEAAYNNEQAMHETTPSDWQGVDREPTPSEQHRQA